MEKVVSCSTVNRSFIKNAVLRKNCASVTTNEVAALNRIRKGSQDVSYSKREIHLLDDSWAS